MMSRRVSERVVRSGHPPLRFTRPALVEVGVVGVVDVVVVVEGGGRGGGCSRRGEERGGNEERSVYTVLWHWRRCEDG
jgi:hypothetical protein